jgi:hypothetical protein
MHPGGLLALAGAEWPTKHAPQLEEGNFVDSFTPEFYVPAFDMYVEVAATDNSASGAKARKVRLLRQLHSEIRIELLSGGSEELLSTFF